MKPAVILVGADKGGVGKTTVSRALLDYLATKNIPARAFDTENPRGTLKRFHSSETQIVDISNISDQMRILDTLAGSSADVTVIDVRAGQFGAILCALRDMGFLDSVNAGEITLIVAHVLGSSVASLDEIAETAPFVANAHYLLVKNFINDISFFEWDPATYASYFKDIRHAGDITIPKLNELAYEKVELAGVSFNSFVADRNTQGAPAGNSFVLRGYVRNWQLKIANEFDRIGLPAMIKGRPSAMVQ